VCAEVTTLDYKMIADTHRKESIKILHDTMSTLHKTPLQKIASYTSWLVDWRLGVVHFINIVHQRNLLNVIIAGRLHKKKQISHIGRSYLKLLQQTKSLFHLLITAIANHAVFFKIALRFLFELQINQQ